MTSPSVVPVTSSALAPGIDVQTHMMQLLTDLFSKLSSVLADKSTDTKSDWPKFSGDSKKLNFLFPLGQICMITLQMILWSLQLMLP